MDDLRGRMDDTTIHMVRLLKERADIAAQIGALKKERGRGINDEHREAGLRDRVMAEAHSIGMSPDMAARFLNHLLAESIRVQQNGAPSHLAVFRRAKEMEDAGRRVIHMEVGEPDFAPPPRAGRALLEGFRTGHTRYGLPGGMARLREALAEHASQKHHASLKPGNVLVTPGARFAVFAAITSLLHPGDEIIIIEPSWPAYREAALYAGAKPRILPTTLEGGWEPSIQDLENAITPRTRMVVLCSPSNPTGKILPANLTDDIMGVAAKRGLYVLSDEIYFDYHYSRTPKSVLEYDYDKSIVTQSFSKSHAMMGLRIGYAISSPGIVDSMTQVSALCLTGVAGVIQYAALKVLDHDTGDNVRAMRSRLRTISDMAWDIGMEFAEPDGGMYVFARAPGIPGSELVERCLDGGLALAPGMGFGHYPQFVRISAGSGDVAGGMHILRDILGVVQWKE